MHVSSLDFTTVRDTDVFGRIAIQSTTQRVQFPGKALDADDIDRRSLPSCAFAK